MRPGIISTCSALGLGLALTCGAVAQTVPPRTPPASPQPTPDRPPPLRPAPGSPGDTLSQSPEVIRPPATGDGGVIRPPNTDKTPMLVIPPPGTPGGDERVQPK